MLLNHCQCPFFNFQQLVIWLLCIEDIFISLDEHGGSKASQGNCWRCTVDRWRIDHNSSICAYGPHDFKQYLGGYGRRRVWHSFHIYRITNSTATISKYLFNIYRHPFVQLNWATILAIDLSFFLRNKFSIFYSTAVGVLTMASSCCG